MRPPVFLTGGNAQCNEGGRMARGGNRRWMGRHAAVGQVIVPQFGYQRYSLVYVRTRVHD